MTLTHLLGDLLWSGVAATGFAILFNVPPRTLLGCIICGASGHALRAVLLEEIGMTLAVGTLLAAIVVGFLGMVFAMYWQAPSAIFAVCGVIPMVPGVFAYETMLGILRIGAANPAPELDLVLETIGNATKTFLILAALATGISVPSLLFRNEKPVV